MVRRATGSHPPALPIRAQVVDTSNVLPRIEGRLSNGEKSVYASSGGLGEWPVDSLVRLTVERMIGVWTHDSLPECEGLMGHKLSLDFYTKSSLVEIKTYNDPNGIIVFVNGDELYRWFENPDDLPTTTHAVIERLNRQGSDWAAQVDLKPGDECIEGPDGTVGIIRGGDWIFGNEEIDNELDDDPIVEDDDEIIEE